MPDQLIVCPYCKKEIALSQAIWAKRERQIERVITNTLTMYGDMQGIIGGSFPKIKSLELKAIAAKASVASSGHGHEDEGED